jgi:hypothetical protein
MTTLINNISSAKALSNIARSSSTGWSHLSMTTNWVSIPYSQTSLRALSTASFFNLTPTAPKTTTMYTFSQVSGGSWEYHPRNCHQSRWMSAFRSTLSVEARRTIIVPTMGDSITEVSSDTCEYVQCVHFYAGKT